MKKVNNMLKLKLIRNLTKQKLNKKSKQYVKIKIDYQFDTTKIKTSFLLEGIQLNKLNIELKIEKIDGVSNCLNNSSEVKLTLQVKNIWFNDNTYGVKIIANI